MAIEIRPINAGVTLGDSAGVASDIDNAKTVLISATADTTITTTTATGRDGGYPAASFLIPENNMVVLHKDPMQKVFASTANATFTKIAYPRG